MLFKMGEEYSNDESETWEDFFGSSVELGSSMLELCDLTPTARKPFKNITVLSPNVQRILAHTKSSPIKCHMQTSSVAKNSSNLRRTRNHNNFPLSGVANKISQSSADLQIQDSTHVENHNNKIENENYAYQQRMENKKIEHIAENSMAEISSITAAPDSNKSRAPPLLCSELTQEHLRIVRPLSTSSTDSSSSCASTNNRADSQYLASIESLADHSDVDHIYEQKTSSVSERVCLEVIHTEQNYVADLRQVIEGYLESWRKNSQLTETKLEILFCNIQEIYDINSQLLEKLRLTENDPIRIAKCFLECSSHFDVYTRYCTNYPHAIALLTELLQAKDTSSLLRETQCALGHKLPLGSYLLKPVQRIMKYHLLLQNLYKHYENGFIEKASQLMTDVAHHIDDVKRHMEQKSRVQELEGNLDGWLGPSLTVLGELCLEGTLHERNHKSRHVFLFEKMLLITKRKEDGRLAYKSHIMCSNLMLVESIQGEPTTFHVIPYDNPKNQCTLQARSVQQKRQWGLELKRLMLEQFKREIPIRAKTLVLGIDPDEDICSNVKRESPKKNYSKPEYLERRHERRRSEMSMRRLNKNRKLLLNLGNISNSNESAVNLENKNLEEKRYSSWYLDEDHSNDMISEKDLSYEQKSFSNECILNAGERDTSMMSYKLDEKSIKRLDPERSQSEPGITYGLLPINVEKSLSNEFPNSTGVQSEIALKYLKPPIKSFEIKQYNTKTLPKKITKIKRQNRSKTSFTSHSKSKFYADLTDNTVLHITETADRIGKGMNLQKSNDGISENDEKMYEYRAENFSSSIHSKNYNNDIANECNYEHIYEELKVVPQSKCGRDVEVKHQKSNGGSPEESEYVVLDELKSQLDLRKSQVSNYKDDINEVSELQALFLEKLRANLEDKISEKNSTQFSKIVSLSAEAYKSNNEILCSQNSNNPIKYNSSLMDSVPQKTGINNKELLLKKKEMNVMLPIYKQGSEHLGSRIANVDYADPRILFKEYGKNSKRKRDLSDNAICDRQAISHTNSQSVYQSSAINIEMDSEMGFYEKSVEDSLENEFLSDSAIYSDDNRSNKTDASSKNGSFKEVDTHDSYVSATVPVASINEANDEENSQREQNLPQGKYSDGWVKQVIGKFQ